MVNSFVLLMAVLFDMCACWVFAASACVTLSERMWQVSCPGGLAGGLQWTWCLPHLSRTCPLLRHGSGHGDHRDALFSVHSTVCTAVHCALGCPCEVHDDGVSHHMLCTSHAPTKLRCFTFSLPPGVQTSMAPSSCATHVVWHPFLCVGLCGSPHAWEADVHQTATPMNNRRDLAIAFSFIWS
jgi:hypothetical protein